MAFDRITEHLAIARFKNVEGQGAMGKKGAVGEQDGAQFIRKLQSCHGMKFRL